MLSRFARHYLLALQFFSRIPVTGRLAHWVGFSPAMLRSSAAHFPGVGVLVGAIACVFAKQPIHPIGGSRSGNSVWGADHRRVS